MTDSLSHLDAAGKATMVDVSAKVPTVRHATAEGYVLMAAGTLEKLLAADTPKGEVLGTARVAGILAAKRAADLIPLCHPLPLEQVTVDFEPIRDAGPLGLGGNGRAAVRITASTVVTAKTGIEMEALTAVGVAALTVYDMLKAVDRGMEISGIRLLSKTGGKADYRAGPRGI